MKTIFKFNYEDLAQWQSTYIIQNVSFTRCENYKHINPNYEFKTFTLTSLNQTGQFVITIFTNDNQTMTFNNSNIDELVTGGTEFEFEAEVTSYSVHGVLRMYSEDLIAFNQDGRTTIFAYSLYSESNCISKTITGRAIFDGKFNSSISIKNIVMDLVDYNFNFNYVYIPSLRRYYYVDSVDIISAEITRLHLKEDVLMSWSSLINNQAVFVTRYGDTNGSNLVDDRRPLEDVLTIEYVTPTMTSSGSLVNTTFKTDGATNEFKFLVSSISSGTHSYQNLPAPSGTNLPTLSSTSSNNQRVQFISESQLSYLIDAVLDDDNIATFIDSVILLPFNPYYPYSSYNTTSQHNAWMGTMPIQASNKVLCDDGKFHPIGSIPSGYSAVYGAQSYLAGCPYFIVADFTIPAHRSSGETDEYIEHEPYTTLEMYLAFVGWVKLNSTQVLGKRIITYYTLDYKTGMGTAFIYNVTDNQLIYSSNCQFGIKLDLTTTNTTEITRQKQANELNMILGLMTSALSIGVGVATENPVAVAGGILGAGKTVASFVNSNNMIFERAQTAFGTSEGVLHALVGTPILRYTYHKKITINETAYAHIQGYPMREYIAPLMILDSGFYCEVGEIHFEPRDSNIFQDEIDEIVSLLKAGVIL